MSQYQTQQNLENHRYGVWLTAGEYEVALVVVKRVERKFHRFADDRDVASHFVVHPLVTEDLESPHLKEF